MQVVNVLPGDRDVTNAVAPHPSLPLLATSGIEDNVKVWEPSSRCAHRQQNTAGASCWPLGPLPAPHQGGLHILCRMTARSMASSACPASWGFHVR